MFNNHLNKKRYLWGFCCNALVCTVLVCGVAHANRGNTLTPVQPKRAVIRVHSNNTATVTLGRRTVVTTPAMAEIHARALQAVQQRPNAPSSKDRAMAQKIQKAVWNIDHGDQAWNVSAMDSKSDDFQFTMSDEGRGGILRGADCQLSRSGQDKPWQLKMEFYTWDSWNLNATENRQTLTIELGKSPTNRAMTAAFHKGIAAYLQSPSN